MKRRTIAVAALLAMVVLAGCATGRSSTDYGAGPAQADLSTGGPGDGAAWEVTVTRVVDGDTVEARFPNGEVDTLRLLGVDTPETTYSRVSPEEFEGVPTTTAGRDHLYDWGERATTFATDELEGRTVRIAVDERADRRGRYGRLLVYVYTPAGNFNERLLSEGYARLYDSDFSLRAAFRATEATAQDEHRGLWAFDDRDASETAGGTTTAVEIPAGIRQATAVSFHTHSLVPPWSAHCSLHSVRTTRHATSSRKPAPSPAASGRHSSCYT